MDRFGRQAGQPIAGRRRGVVRHALFAGVVSLGIAFAGVVPILAHADSAATTTAAAGSGAGSAPADAVSSAGAKWFGIAATRDGDGYWVVSNGGAVAPYGDAVSHGDMSKTALNQSMVGMAPTHDGKGYWLVAGDGGIFSFGDAAFLGSTGSLHLNKPVVGMAPTHDGGGYWMVASDGGIFSFGDAAFLGSTGSLHLNKPVVGMAPTHDGDGYWMVASDGGIFSYGDAPFEGSLGAHPPASPIVYMAPTPDNNGYWLLSADGTVYPFGDAGNDGSLAGASAPATALAAPPSGGYWILTADGAVHAFGHAQNYGSPATGPQAASPTANAAATTQSSGSSTPPGGATSAVSIRAVTPSNGTAGGGETIQISGGGFTGATAVDFGPNGSSDFTVTSPTTITAIAPVGAATVDVRVVTAAGTSSLGSADRFTYVPTGQAPITAQGQSLEIGGVPTVFTGVNAYQLATDWGINAGCGGMASTAQMDAFFASLPPRSLVRFWAFQGSMATNVHTGQLDWRPLDNVFYAAAKYHVYLIPAVSGQGSTCDGTHWQDPAWYSGGFMNVYNSATDSDGRGLTPLSYWAYMNALVSRYADSPALGMWEPMSEPEASTCAAAFEPTNCAGHQTCPDEPAAAAALQYFFTTVGGRIHHLDPEHLVEAGFIGSGQCGTTWNDYQGVGGSSGIDVLSVHDYYGSVPLGGDRWNGLAERFAQAKALDKPIITGEVGIVAGVGQTGCESLPQRATELSTKMAAQFAAGDSAFLVWSWVLDPLGPCSYNTGPADTSLLGALAASPSGGV